MRLLLPTYLPTVPMSFPFAISLAASVSLVSFFSLGSFLPLALPVAAQSSYSSGSFTSAGTSPASVAPVGVQNGGYQAGGFSPGINQPTGIQALNYLIGGGYRYGASGAFLNPYGQPVYLNPLVPYVWPSARPQFTGGAAFTSRIGNFNCNFWRGNSGYYYPFLSNNFLYAPIMYIDNSSSTPQAKLPPPAIQLTDTLKYLEDSMKDKKVSDAQYKHLRQRALDLQRKERSMRIAQGGELDADSEAEIRRDLDGLAKETSEHVKDR
ncbi:hypothetical protein BH11CYA1_BH11CYA1_18560 [soil metagenome]